MTTPENEKQEPKPEEFEEFVGALLQVDPSGLSGKHRSEEPTPYTARARRTGTTWTVSVAGVSAFELVDPDPTEDMVKAELARVLDRSPDSIRVQLDRDYIGLAP